jgi:hypothetical protein
MTTALPARGRSPVACGIVVHARCTARLGEIATLRDRAGPPGSPPLPARFLRHADEQTVVGLHAVLAALAAAPEPRPDLARQGVVAAACLSGRVAAARTLRQFHAQGAVGVSPHVVPQCSLHSIAGAVSVALGMHGPHLGVGGGTDALAEGMLAALSLVRAGATRGDPLPGVWLVATAWNEEPRLDDDATPTNDPVCESLAMLVVPDPTTTLAIEFLPHETPVDDLPPAGIAECARALDICRAGIALESWSLACPWAGAIRVTRRHRGAASAPRGRPAWREAA